MKYIYLMRHGKVHNPDDIAYGGLPGFHLSERGKEMAHEAAEHFRSEEVIPSKIISSPYERARETAHIIAQELGVQVQIDEAVVDWDMGKWTGGKNEDFRKNSGYYDKPIKMDDLEPLDQAADRMMDFFQRTLSDMYEGEAVLVVTHRENSAAALLKLQDQNYEYIHDVRLPMGSVWLLKFEDGGTFVTAEFKWGAASKG